MPHQLLGVTMKVRDVPMGCLFITFSLFPAAFAWSLSEKPNFLVYVAIYGCVVISSMLFSVGKHLVVGLELDKDEE